MRARVVSKNRNSKGVPKLQIKKMESKKELIQPEWIQKIISLGNKKADQKEAVPPYKAEAPITNADNINS